MNLNDLLGKRFTIPSKGQPTFVTVVRVNPTTKIVGLWLEGPGGALSASVPLAEFEKMDLARA